MGVFDSAKKVHDEFQSINIASTTTKTPNSFEMYKTKEKKQSGN